VNRHRVACAVALLCASAAAIGQTTPPPGTYESNNGDLTVTADGGRTLFEINSVGGNGHTCGLQGEIRAGKAQLEGSDGPCLVTFRPADHGIDVAANEACRYWCGARAMFEGKFLNPDAACASRARSKVRKAFQAAYDRKDYAAARATLDALLADCANEMPWMETLSLRNDLAITLYHLHDRAACLAALEPLAEDAAGSDDDLLSRGEVEAEVMRPVVRAARTNLKLCKTLPEAQ